MLLAQFICYELFSLAEEHVSQNFVAANRRTKNAALLFAAIHSFQEFVKMQLSHMLNKITFCTKQRLFTEHSKEKGTSSSKRQCHQESLSFAKRLESG